MAHKELGELVRAWRRASGLSLATVAVRLHTGKAAVSQYESAKREITFETMKALDDLYGAGGGLFDMAQALGAPSALPARESWVFHRETARPGVAAHFGEGHAPCQWYLLRSRPGHGRVEGTLSRGPTTFDLSVPCDDGGVFVQLPARPRPATVAVRLHAAGWVDQGRGQAPGHLGRPVVTLPSDPRLRMRVTPTVPDAGLAGVREGAGLLSIATPYDATVSRFTGEGYRRLREGRCYILEDVARWATKLLPTARVGADTIRRLEQGKASRCRFLRSRLDVVYEAGGYTTDETVDVHGSRERFEVHFPQFWVGPVWLEFHSETQPWANVHLRHGAHVEAVRVVPGACVVDERRRRDAEPYVVKCPLGWTVRAGLGARPAAPAVDLDSYGIRSAVAETVSLLPA